MENQNQNKTRSIRATDEIFTKFKALCDENNGTNDTLSMLINSYELQKSKEILKGAADNIDDFKTRIDGIIKAYISALELTANTEERIRNEFAVQLDSQTRTIHSLQRENESIKAETIRLQTEAQNEIRALKADLAAVQTALQTAKANEQRATESKAQAEQITALTKEKLEKIQKTVGDLQERAAETDRYKEEIQTLQTALQNKDREKEKIISDYESQIQTLVNERATAIQAAINQTTAEYQKQIAELQQQQAIQLANIIAKTTAATTPTKAEE